MTQYFDIPILRNLTISESEIKGFQCVYGYFNLIKSHPLGTFLHLCLFLYRYIQFKGSKLCMIHVTEALVSFSMTHINFCVVNKQTPHSLKLQKNTDKNHVIILSNLFQI